MPIDVAGHENLDFLYHYQGFDLERLRDILFNKRVYFSNPADFNDPWDSRPYFGETADKSHPLSSEISEFNEQYWAEIRKKYRIYCLSKYPDNALLWAHYTVKHTGVCLKFSAKNDLFFGAMKIDYQEQHPISQIESNNGLELIKKILLTKSADWRYENEYRIVSTEKSFALNSKNELISNNGYVGLQEELVGIIVGCQATKATIEGVKFLVQYADYPVEVFRAKRNGGDYGLTIEKML